MKIKNLEALKERIEYYKKMFPNTYTTLEDIYETFENYPCNSYCGISVSNEEWPDKCYTFDVCADKEFDCEFLGMGKS